MASHKPGLSYQTGSGTIVQVTNTYTANTEVDFDAVVPPSTVNLLFNISFPTDDLICCLLSSDQAVTLNVNSTTTPTPAIVLQANKPVIWTNDGGVTNPFSTTPVTAIYINNATINPANVKLYALIDSD